MGFIPPLNLGGFQPSPATLAQWVYQIWQYLQENPIATQEQLQEYIGTFITTSPETQAMIGAGVEEYLTENPPTAPVQSVQGKTGAVQLAYNEIVPASNAVPVYKASSTPSTNTLVGQYNIGYRLFVNTATQEIFTISPAGALSLVGRGKFDGTTVDLNSADGDTTINEAVSAINDNITTITGEVNSHSNEIASLTTSMNNATTPEAFNLTNQSSNVAQVDCNYINKIAIVNIQFNGNGGTAMTLGNIPSKYRPTKNQYIFAASHTAQDIKGIIVGSDGNITTASNTVNNAEYRFTAIYITA